MCIEMGENPRRTTPQPPNPTEIAGQKIPCREISIDFVVKRHVILAKVLGTCSGIESEMTGR
jgi:hypothetical protein